MVKKIDLANIKPIKLPLVLSFSDNPWDRMKFLRDEAGLKDDEEFITIKDEWIKFVEEIERLGPYWKPNV